MHETKFFFYVLMKTGYFNTGFVFLRYKNTNQYQAKFSRKIHKNFKKRNFFKFFVSFFFGPDPSIRAGPNYSGWARIGPAMNSGSLLFTCYVNSGG